MVESQAVSSDSLQVTNVAFNRSGTHYLLTHLNGVNIYELNRLGDMQKNKLCWVQKVDGGVNQAEFLYSSLYDVSSS